MRAPPSLLGGGAKFNDPLLDSLVERAVQVQPGSAFGRSAHTRGPGIAGRDRFRRLADAWMCPVRTRAIAPVENAIGSAWLRAP